MRQRQGLAPGMLLWNRGELARRGWRAAAATCHPGLHCRQGGPTRLRFAARAQPPHCSAYMRLLLPLGWTKVCVAFCRPGTCWLSMTDQPTCVAGHESAWLGLALHFTGMGAGASCCPPFDTLVDVTGAGHAEHMLAGAPMCVRPADGGQSSAGGATGETQRGEARHI